MEKAIEVKGLQRSFKETEVLKGVDIEVKQREIFALLGSDSAGADLTGSSFWGSVVREANFDGANLTGRNLSTIDLSYTALKGVGADLSKVSVV
jgi:uncharacterized protein YjbI with pentapeptide repeats